MLLLVHITLALSSLILSTFAAFRPTKPSLIKSGILVSLTLLTGTVLVVKNQSHLMEACLSGIVYTGFVITTLLIASKKLASIKSD
jgi:hypothetical protein